jgi:hypothetical protein
VKSLLLSAAWVMQACVVIAPLEDVRATELVAPRAPMAGRVSGGTGGSAPAAASGGSGGTRVQPDASVDEDAGPMIPSCEPIALTPCNPVKQCGCKPGELCALTDDEAAISCVAGSGGNKARGESCQHTSDCMPGLECPVTHLCSAYCSRDADCGMGERCVPYENEMLHQTVTGSGSCQTQCDPVTGNPCASNARCLSSVEARTFKWAVCTSTEGVTFTPRGVSCDDDQVVCEPKLACSRFGQELCLPVCRTNDDCPADLPRCYIVDRVAAPSDKLGDCWYDPCDDTTVPAPAAWTAGPVVDAARLAECQAACGPKLSADMECVKTRCGAELSRCIQQAQEACTAAKQGPCRAQYVAASCVDWRARIGKQLDYENCVEANQACSTQAQALCTSSS